MNKEITAEDIIKAIDEMFDEEKVQENETFWRGYNHGIMRVQQYIVKLNQELQIKDDEIKQLQGDIVNHIKIASEYKEQMIIKDNIINELKYGIKKLDEMFYETFRISQNGYYLISKWELKNFTDKIKELENSRSDE